MNWNCRRNQLRHGRHDRKSLCDRERLRAHDARLFRRRLSNRSSGSHLRARHQRGRHRRRQLGEARSGRWRPRGPGKLRRGAGPGLLRARRRGAHGDGRQRRGRTARSAELSRRSDEAGPRAARAAIGSKLAQPLNLTVDTAALGILRIANAQMANAVRAVTTAKGLDPRDFAMFAYGGAGPLHAVDVARELGLPR